MTKIKNLSIVTILLLISTALSVLSQIPILQSSLRVLMLTSWVLTFIVSIFKSNVRLNNFTIIYILIYALFLVSAFFADFIFGNINHLNGNYVYFLFIPFFIYFICLNSDAALKRNIKKILIVYSICSLIYAVYLFFNYFTSFRFWLSDYTYAYQSKNSAGQIFASSIVFLLSTRSKNKANKFVKILLALFLLFILIILKCRTSLLGLAFALFVYVFFINKNKKTVLLMISLVIGLVIFSLINDRVGAFIAHAFGLDKYSTLDLNVLSSGRLDLYKKAITIFTENLAFGTGYYYVDNFYLSVLTAAGLFAGTAIIILWIYRIILNIKNASYSKNSFSQILLMLTCFYFIESLLEGLPPFGPGVCSFMFWVLMCFSDISYSKKLAKE